MKIQCVTVSVNYSDFFVHVIEENYKLFDKWIVVTDTKDQATKDLCDKFGVTCVQTDVFYQQGARFNKFAGIREGLKYVDDDAWTIFLDSDIVLHWSTRRVLESLNLKEDFIYGIDRLNCTGYDAWIKYKQKLPEGYVFNNWLMHSAGLEMGARLIHLYGVEGDNGKFGGWNPLGFFQLTHRSSFDTYPMKADGADHCDLVFSKQYPRNKRELIPELYAVHLESLNAKKADNWWGRVTEPFVAKIPEPPAPVVEPLVEPVKVEAPVQEVVQVQTLTLREAIQVIVKIIKEKISSMWNSIKQYIFGDPAVELAIAKEKYYGNT